MDDEVVVARGNNCWYQQWSKEDLLAPLPSPPEFDGPIEAVRQRITKIIGKLSVPRDIRDCHPVIDRLLKEDEKQREKQLATPYPMSWDAPRFDSPCEQRRLRILNILFLAAAKMNGKPLISSRDARSIQLTFYQQHVPIKLDRSKQRNNRSYAARAPRELSDTKLSFAILRGFGSEEERATWQDDDTGKLESRVTEIAVEIVLTAEIQHRESAIRQYQWRVERKSELEEEERKRKLEAERAEIQRKKRIERARVDRLLNDAAAFQRAGAIRKFVEAIRSAQGGSSTSEDLDRWCEWALAQADRIDPAIGGAYLKEMRDEDDTELIKNTTKT